MTPAFIEAMIEGQGGTDQEFNGVRLWDGWSADASPWIGVRLTQLRTMPELVEWLLYAIVRRSDRQMLGHAGFHSGPGPAYLRDIAPGGIEIGYSVFEPFRGRGHATAGASALIQWARREHGVRDFVASIARENTASQRVAGKLGFNRFRDFDQNDPDREDLYLLRMDKVRHE